jgi:hypothetical protein
MVRDYGKHQQNQRAKAARDHASSILNFLNPRQGEEETIAQMKMQAMEM